MLQDYLSIVLLGLYRPDGKTYPGTKDNLELSLRLHEPDPTMIWIVEQIVKVFKIKSPKPKKGRRNVLLFSK
jgi:hypothetical protein